MSLRALSAVAALAFAASAPLACKRPVVGRDFAGASITDLTVEPEFARQGVPIAIRFRLDGGPQGSITYSIGSRSAECLPTRLPDGRYECIHPEVTRQAYPQGAVDVTVRGKDRVGKETSATGRITLDFDCPLFTQLSISPAIGRPDTTAVVLIESNELLREPPIVTRGNMFWEAATGSGNSYRVDHPVTDADATASGEVIVVITDLAGNKSSDCGIGGNLPFGVDREVPQVNPYFVELYRDIPGLPARISAQPGAFTDDVEVAEVRVFEDDGLGGERRIATLVPAADGSLPDTSLTVTPSGRIRMLAVDGAETESEKVYIAERWRISAGQGLTRNSGVRTAVRYTSAPPGSPAMENRTREAASKIFASDNQSAEINARVGFRSIGTLPASYRDTIQIVTGYDPQSQSILAFGGRDPNILDHQRDDTLVIRWNELTHEYENTIITAGGGNTPIARTGTNFAFDGSGCGLLFGGERHDRFLNDTWRLCPRGSTWAWQRVEAINAPTPRFTPILWDPQLRRFAILGGYGAEYSDLHYLDPAYGSNGWRWVQDTGLPDSLSYTTRLLHAFYYDAIYGGYALTLGIAVPYYEDQVFWTYRDGGWGEAYIPFEISGRTGFGYAHDAARGLLIVWGDQHEEIARFDPDTWFVAGDPRDGPQTWRRVNLSPSIARGWPTLVYDSDRESTIVFGGARFVDQQSVPPIIEEIVVSPSYPTLQASLDLATRRPAGIAELEIAVHATGAGDGDGVGPGTNRSGGVIVKLYDHEARAWVEAASQETPPAGAPVIIRASITDRPERFVSFDGVVPVTVVTRWPATEDADARLDIDVVDGSLHLAPELPQGARIEQFLVAPDQVERGRTATITWAVANAPDGVELYAGGVMLRQSAEAEGSYLYTATATSGANVTFELRAKNATGGNAIGMRTLDVRPSLPPPLIVRFSAAQKVGPRGGLMNLSWQTERATSLRILLGTRELLSTSTQVEQGSFDVLLPLDPTETSTAYTLEATNEAGRELRQTSLRLANEVVLVGPGNSQTFTDSILVSGETDLFVLQMVAPGYIDAKIFAPASPDCIGVDTRLTLNDENLDYVGYDDDDGEERCSHINRFEDSFALLTAGTYYLEVEEYYGNLIPAYTLDVNTFGIQCGNGIREPTEACDDGNTTGGDGCSATCTYETLGTYTAPDDGRVVFAEAITPLGNIDVYLLQVTSGTYVTMETFAPDVAGGCPSGDTSLELLSEDMSTVLASDDDGGIGFCSLMTVALAPGTYFVLVHGYNDNELVPAYELVFDSLTNIQFETEPNDTSAQAHAFGTISAGTAAGPIAAAIDPAAEDDYFSFTLSAPGTVTVTTFTALSNRSCSGPDLVMTLLDSLQTQLAYNDDRNGRCPVLDGIGGIDTELINLPAGTYYLLLQDYGDNDMVPSYFIEVSVQ